MNKTKTAIHSVVAFMILAAAISCKVEPEIGDTDISKTNETEKDTTAPSPVRGLDIAFGGEGELLLKWIDPNDDDLFAIKVYYPIDEEGYFYRSDGEPRSFRQAVSLDDGFLVNKETQSYKFKGLPVPNMYSFKVSAVDKNLNESTVESRLVSLSEHKDDEIFITPSPVVSPSAECVDGTMKISWKNPSENDYFFNEDKFWGVKITSEPSNGAFTTPVYVKSYAGYESLEVFECKNLVDGDIYSFTITALDTALHEGNCVTSNQVKFAEKIKSDDTIPPGPVTSAKITAGDKKVVLSWTNPSDADFYGTRIEVRATTQGQKDIPIPDPIVIEGNPSETSSAVFEGLKNGIRYSFFLYALDKNQNASEYVRLRDYPTDTSDKVAPAEVTEFAVTASDGNALLTWKNPVDSDFAGVKISGTPADGTLSNPVVLGKEAESLVVSGLKTGGTYAFKIQTFDESLNFSDGTSLENVSVPDSTDYVAPAEVTDFAVTAKDGMIVLSWKNPADDDFWGVEIMSDPADGLLKNPVYLQNSENFECFNLKNGETYKFTIKTMDFNLNKSSGVLSDEIVFNSKYSPEFTSFTIPKAGTNRSPYSSNKVTATVKGKYFTYLDVQKDSFELSCPENPSVVANAELEVKSDSMIAISFDIPSSAGIYELSIKYAARSISGNFVVKDYADYSDKIGYIILADGTFVNPDEYKSIDEKNPPVAVFAGFNYNGAAIGVGFRCSSRLSSEDIKWAGRDNDGKSYGYRLICDDIACEVNGETSRFDDFEHKYLTINDGSIDTVSFSGDSDGSNNWDIICAFDPQGALNPEQNYPAFAWANLYGSKYKDCLGTATDGWYLPSAQELFLAHSLLHNAIVSTSKLKALDILESLDKDRKYMPSSSDTNVFYQTNEKFWTSSNVVYRNDYSLSFAWAISSYPGRITISEVYKITSEARPPLVLVVKTF